MNNIVEKKNITIANNNNPISKYDLNQFCLQRIESGHELNAFITRCPRDEILKQALEADQKTKNNQKTGKLAGIPIAIKDNLCTEGIKTTCASQILSNFVPAYDATVIKKIRDEGGIIIGKTNMDEFAMGSSNENSFFGSVKNPWNNNCVPGGSSGGSTCAVAAGFAAAALGSDTGGSIRQPAAFCGVVGLKPTYGRVSRFGLIAFASSLDQIGPITNNVYDNALLMEVIAGHDPLDSTNKNISVPPYTRHLDKSISELIIGIPGEYFSDSLHPEIKKSINHSIQLLKKRGVKFLDISLPLMKYSIPCYYVLAPSEASSNLARYDGVRYGMRISGEKDLISMYHDTKSSGFGAEVKRRIMLGTYTLSSGYYDAYYLKALKVRNLITKEFIEVFKSVDAIISPVTPNLPFKMGEKKDNPIEMYLSDIYTVSANLAGIPAISVPCGFAEGLPIGIQFTGKHFDEALLYRISYQLEQSLSLEFPDPN